MNLELYYRILKHDPEGRLVKDSGLIPSGSYVVQFLEFIHRFFMASDLQATDVDNTEYYIYWKTGRIDYHGHVAAEALDDGYGIVVGTNDGVTAEANTDYKLDTKILHDAAGAAGKLNYRDVLFVATREVGANVDLDIIRPFINETVATITVKEIGLICKETSGVRYHLLLRDVVSDEDVEAGYTLTVAYTLRTTA